MKLSSPRYLVAGQLNREYTLLPNGEALLDVLGGNVLYAGVGVSVWEPDPPPGIVARVGEDFPLEWIETSAHRGLDMRGVHVLSQEVDLRSFTAYSTRTIRSKDDPVTHFAEMGLPFPKELLGYRDPSTILDSRIRLSPASLRQRFYLRRQRS